MSEITTANPPRSIPARLLRTWRIWVITSLILLGLLLFLLKEAWPEGAPLSFFVYTYTVLAYQLYFLRRQLHLNQRAGESEILTHFGPGNSTSILRGFTLVLLAGFLFAPRPSGWQAWLPAILYTTGDILDYLDGYLARRSDHVTPLGERMDMEWDALGLMIATMLAVWYGILSLIFLPIGLARYAFIFGLWLRARQGKVNYDLPPSRSRRPIAGLTMGYMSAMLWPIIPYPTSVIAGAIFFIPFALSFGRDWLVVSGALDPESTLYRAWHAWLTSTLLGWFPLVVRLLLVLTLWSRVWEKMLDFNMVVGQYTGFGFPSPVIVVMLFGGIELIALLSIAIGFGGRFAAFLLIFPIGFTIVGAGQDVTGIILLICDLLILILGTGKLSLWKPSETLFGQRARSA